MKKFLILKVLICALSFGGVLYAYLEQQNDLTKLKIGLPELSKEIRILEEENTHLRYEIEQFENPKHLMELAKRPEFSHLKHPIVNEVLVMSPGPEIEFVEEVEENNHFAPLLPRILMGAKVFRE